MIVVGWGKVLPPNTHTLLLTFLPTFTLTFLVTYVYNTRTRTRSRARALKLGDLARALFLTCHINALEA
jgi:hypothetical protein